MRTPLICGLSRVTEVARTRSTPVPVLPGAPETFTSVSLAPVVAPRLMPVVPIRETVTRVSWGPSPVVAAVVVMPLT